MKISTLNFFNSFFVSLVFTLVIGYYFIVDSYNDFETKAKIMQERYINSQKKLVKLEVKRVIERINHIRGIAYDKIEKTLKSKVITIENVIKNHSKIDFKEGSHLYNLLDSFQWDNDTGYYFVFDNFGTIIFHKDKFFIGKNVFDFNNKKLRRVVEGAIGGGECFGYYEWSKPNKNKSLKFKKFSYIKYIKEANVYVGTGIYIDEFDKSLKKYILDELKFERYGVDRYGYFWVHNSNLIMLMHPLDKNLTNGDVSKFKTKDNKYIFREMEKIVKESQGGYLEYFWYKPTSKDIQEKKISYIEKLEDWDWRIGSGFYLSDLSKVIKNEKKLLKQFILEDIEHISIILISLFIITFFITIYISKKIREIEILQIKNLNMLNQYKLILDESSIVSKTDLSGKITYVNEHFLKLTKLKIEEVIGNTHKIVRHPTTPKEIYKKLWKIIESGAIWKGVIKNKDKFNEIYFNKITIMPIKDENGKIIEYISAGSDISELIENRNKLENIFKSDTLTGLGSRIKLLEDIEENSNLILALIDIDRFREINDLYQQNIGDTILKEVANRLLKEINLNNSIIYRIQADIFAILSINMDLQTFKKKTLKVIENISKTPYQIDEQNNILLSFTMGIANEDTNILAYADIALKSAKNSKKPLIVYNSNDTKITKEYENNIIWIKKLNEALSRDKIIPFFQPIYNYSKGKIEKFEALIRLIDEDGVIVSPFYFIDISKKTRIYPKLTKKMIEKSIEIFKKLNYEFSINLSVEDLLNTETMDFLYTLARNNNVLNRIVLEIVESEELQSYEEVQEILTRFKQKGAKVAIDDFGSGYSNFEYLIYLKADYIKIDGSIVKHLESDERAVELVKSIVAFAKKSNMKTIAEFISSKELSNIVLELGVDYAQGYYYGKPEAEVKI